MNAMPAKGQRKYFSAGDQEMLLGKGAHPLGASEPGPGIRTPPEVPSVQACPRQGHAGRTFPLVKAESGISQLHPLPEVTVFPGHSQTGQVKTGLQVPRPVQDSPKASPGAPLDTRFSQALTLLSDWWLRSP